jgi:peroxin-10
MVTSRPYERSDLILAQLRATLVLTPAFLSYGISRFWSRLPARYAFVSKLHLPEILDFFTDLNLALFYIRGTYYNGLKRLLGVRYVSVMH